LFFSFADRISAAEASDTHLLIGRLDFFFSRRHFGCQGGPKEVFKLRAAETLSRQLFQKGRCAAAVFLLPYENV
jgi:hypothetical protein